QEVVGRRGIDGDAAATLPPDGIPNAHVRADHRRHRAWPVPASRALLSVDGRACDEEDEKGGGDVPHWGFLRPREGHLHGIPAAATSTASAGGERRRVWAGRAARLR